MIKRDYFMDGRYFMRGIIGTAVGMALLAVTLAVMAVCGGLNPDHCRDYLVREGADPDVIRSLDDQEYWGLEERVEFGQYLTRWGLHDRPGIRGDNACRRIGLFPKEGGREGGKGKTR